MRLNGCQLPILGRSQSGFFERPILSSVVGATRSVIDAQCISPLSRSTARLRVQPFGTMLERDLIIIGNH